MLNDNKITQMQDHVKQGNPFQSKLILITFCISNINFQPSCIDRKKEFASTKDNSKSRIFNISWKNQVTTSFNEKRGVPRRHIDIASYFFPVVFYSIVF